MSTGAPTRRAPRPAGRGVLVPLVTVVLAVLAVWRASVGADLSDGTHVVALAMRMAQGDAVLADEMNVQAFGSLPAVPFVWLWLQLVGVEGIVLASRLFYLVLAFGVGALCYRALRVALPPGAALTAAVLMLGPVPYGLLVTSYNTMPVLTLGLAACAGFAALVTGSPRWSATSGAALAVAVLSHPASLPACAVMALTLLVLARRRPVRLGVLAGGGAVSLLIVLLLVVGPGLTALSDTLAYTAEYQAGRRPPLERLREATLRYLDGVRSWRFTPAAALAALAVLPRLPDGWRAAAAAGVPVAAAAAAWAVVPSTIVPGEPLGLHSGAFVLVVTPLLWLPVAVWAHRRRVREVRTLLALTTPLAVVGVVSFSMLSSAHVQWGVAAPPVQPLFGALGAAVVLGAARHGRPWAAGLAVVALVGSLVAVHPLRTFHNADPRQLVGRVAAGPLAGLLTDADLLEADCRLRALVPAWVGAGESVFFYARPGGYAYSTARMDTNIVWLSDFGEANAWTVDWWERTGRWPDVAVVHPGAVQRAGGWEALASQDPVVAALDEGYGPPREREGYLVLRRDGSDRQAPAVPPEGCPPGP
ncbi:hypothetical protein [Ornithinimicrobium pekingense]|uniref:Glycosyltransferase RgtA/B/C/D-like domain-containing protein n=1 Tax=Ornithinimicrobium pekingense TaxID=384677 RepID=A0ABQ2FAM7_9MICO|nr:hypothetical protein [Ornithinimicrobium pekingense]GGK73588.1 hypothetical protein GCM10011509_22750 [Ornithinimicrobium pekingense]